MLRISRLSLITVLMLGCISLSVMLSVVNLPERASAHTYAAPTKRVRLAIGGMDCKGCETGISGELMRTPGVIAAQVSFPRREAVVDYDPARITPAGIIARIKGAGFTAKVKRG